MEVFEGAPSQLELYLLLVIELNYIGFTPMWKPVMQGIDEKLAGSSSYASKLLT